MSHLDEARYGRACLLVLNVCPFTLRQVIDNYYSRHGFSSLQDFLDNNKHALFHLSHKWCCCRLTPSRTCPMYKSQLDELYIKNMLPCSTGQHRGDCPCQYKAKPGISSNVMDITLCCLMITNICSGPPGINMNRINTIREIRNKLIHGSSARLDEITFKDYWNKVETAISDLAIHVSSALLTDTQKMMDELKRRMMDPHELGELRKLILDQKKFAELEERVSVVESDHDKRSKHVAEMGGRLAQAATKLTDLEETVKQTAGASQKIPGLEAKVEQAKRKISDLEDVVGEQGEAIKQLRREPGTDDLSDEEPKIRQLRKRLIDINNEMTKKIPLSPLQEGDEKTSMRIELLYASVVISEDPNCARKERSSLQHKREDFFGKYILGANIADDRTSSELDIGSYKYASHSDSDMASTSSDKDKFDELLPMSRFLYGVSHQNREVTNPDDIFKKNDKVARNIYMLGDAARGKTTYCLWLLKKWCNAQQRNGVGNKELDKWEKALHEFHFVFILQFRYVNPNLASVIDMICHDVFHRDTEYHDAIRHVLSSGKYRSLIILDGLDEWNPDDETKQQLTYKEMPKIPVSSNVSCFFTMRPWVFTKISKMVKINDRVIEILGLSETGMEKVIENVLLNHYKLKDDLSKYLAAYNKIERQLENKSLKSFMQIPMLAVVCVQIWYKEKKVGDSMTSFYAVMVDMLIERAYQKHELKTIHDKTFDCKLPHILSDKENIANHLSVLLKLGKVAYEGLLSDETNLVFQKRKLQKEVGEGELQLALDVGLISQKEAPSLVTRNVSVHFFHKSIQEFLAVIYIVTNKEVSDSFCTNLSNVKVIMELSDVIMFICGMCPSLGRVISQCVVSVTDNDTEICKYRESPRFPYNSTVEELYKLQVTWYRELHYGNRDSPVTQTDSPVTQTDSPVTDTDRQVTQTDSQLTFHVSDVYLDSFYRDTETVRVTRELLSDHHVNIRSLCLWSVPSDGENGISNTLLGDFLSNTHKTRSLVTLCINGYKTDRSVRTLCVPTLRCLNLQTITINTHLGGNVCPPLMTHMSQLRKLWLVNVTLGEGGLGLSLDIVNIEKIVLHKVTLGEGGLRLSPEMVHIEEVELQFVNMPAAEWGEFVRSASNIQHKFNVVLLLTNIDDESLTKIRSSPDFTETLYHKYRSGWYELDFTRVWPPSQLTQVMN